MIPSTATALSPLQTFGINVLLVDDQEIVGEAVRKMLQDQPDIKFHFCKDPSQAIELANQIKPTVILQDLIMPDVDGLMLVKFFRANGFTRDIPLIVLSSKEEPTIKAEAFALGANDYMVKLPDKIELIARIRYHSAGYTRLLERNQAYEKLTESQRVLHSELAEAAAYVRSLLPDPLKGEVETSWRYLPSTQLGGDAFGYHWLDDRHLALYLLDVCGHGVGAALLGITVMTVLRSQTLPGCDFLDPSDVLKHLNETFQMEKHNNMFFTIWYGVYDKKACTLTFSSGGHPPAILISNLSKGQPEYSLLKTEGMVIGGMTGVDFPKEMCRIKPGDRLYVLSDGVYEISNPDGSTLNFDDFLGIMKKNVSMAHDIDDIVQTMQKLNGPGPFADDFSILRITFGRS